VVPRVLRRKFLRALLHNRDRLQPNYCDFSLPGLCYLLENTRHIDREGFVARRSIQLRYGRAVMESATYEFSGLSVLHTLCIIGKPRKFHALSSFRRPEAFCIIEQRTDFVHHKDDRLRKEFEKWAVLTYTNNRAVINERKGADAGIDGIPAGHSYMLDRMPFAAPTS
jgi:hypothetical protein